VTGDELPRGDEVNGQPPREVELPPGLEVVRTTKVFDIVTVPHGLLRSHELAADVWARLVVESGSVVFVFEDAPSAPRRLNAGEHQAIPPARGHRITPGDDATFHLEFLRAADG
jgi:tellurite resistance-related uncharacterized protein